jgi:hypothetical protein
MKLKSLLDYVTEPRAMSDEDTETFLRLVLLEQNEGSGPDVGNQQQREILDNDFICTLTSKRLKLADVTCSPATLMWVAIQSAGHLAKGVMWAYTICAIAEKRGLSHITLEEMTFAFPNAFPIEEEYRQCWEAQKKSGAPLANAMDMPENWKIGEAVQA